MTLGRVACDRLPLQFSVSSGAILGRAKSWLTVPAQLRSPALQILVPGDTYSHLYCDWPARRK